MPDMPTDLPESWHLDSGLREDMVLSIHASYFAPSADYQDGKVLMLHLVGTDENEEPVTLKMSVGADWTTDDGNVITHPTKRKQHINKNSVYGHFISYCFEIPELGKILVERGNPTDARIWSDLILHLENRTIKYGRNIPDQERLMPTEYLGLTVDSSPTTVSPTPTAPAPAPTVQPELSPQELVAQAKARAQGSAVTNGSPHFMRAIGMAQNAPDFATFLSLALDDSDILADDELAEQCADKDQIWAQAHAS